MSNLRKILLVFFSITFLASAVALFIFLGGASLFSSDDEVRPAKAWQERELYLANILDELVDKNIWEVDEMTTADMKVMDKYLDLYEQNPDLIGWLQIGGTKIDYPVMQSKYDPEFYLYHAFDGSYLYEGSLFLDAASDLDDSLNFMIYGHNMDNGNKFGQLSNYRNESFFLENPTFRFDTIYQEAEYEVVAVFLSQIYYKSANVFKYYKWPFIGNETDFNNYVENIEQMSLYNTGKTATWGDQLVTLSTCYYHTEDGRFVVVGRKITD